MSKSKTNRAALSSRRIASFTVTAAVAALALLATPGAGQAQGIVRGAQEGSAEGGRIAGPVGGLVGGAVGAGVGGAVGAVDGILGIPTYRWHHHCRGYRDGEGYFHCYHY
jgi:hypothetical protein